MLVRISAVVLLFLASIPAEPVPPDAAYGPAGRLLELVNQDRAAVHLPPLQWDAGLARAAHAHATAMAAAHELSHQLNGEPSLPSRLLAASSLRLDAEGENVALNVSIDGAHQGLMHSPPHRANILDAQFNYAGFAAVWDNGQLWVVEDFAHAMRTYSAEDAEDQVAAVVESKREKAGLRPLRRIEVDGLRDAACSMAQADRLQTSAVSRLSKKYNVVVYAQTDLSAFPVSNLPGRADLHNFSAAVCYARTSTYPGGAYWVIALLY